MVRKLRISSRPYIRASERRTRTEAALGAAVLAVCSAPFLILAALGSIDPPMLYSEAEVTHYAVSVAALGMFGLTGALAAAAGALRACGVRF